MLKPLLMFSALLLWGPTLQEPAPAHAPAPAPSTIPAEAAHMVNPVKSTPESLARAKKVYGNDCAMCHGANGDGKGELVADLKLVNLKDFTDPAVLKDTTDGEIFYIIKNGKAQMPAEGDRAKTEELWNLVVVVRSFAKK